MLVGSVALRTGAPVKSGIVSIVDGGTLDVELFDDVDGTVVLAKTVVLDAGGRLETAVEVGDAVTAVAGLGELEEGAVEVEVPDCARATVASPEQPTKTANIGDEFALPPQRLTRDVCVCVFFIGYAPFVSGNEHDDCVRRTAIQKLPGAVSVNRFPISRLNEDFFSSES